MAVCTMTMARCSIIFLFIVSLCCGLDEHICKPPRLLGHKNEVYVYLIEDFFSKEECDSVLEYRVNQLKQYSKNSPIVCFNSLSTFLWYMHPKPMEGRFMKGTMCVNESQSIELLSRSSSSNKRPITYSSSYALYPNEQDETLLFTTLFEDRLTAITTEDLIPEISTLFKEEKGGKYQITRYEQGQGYASHTDCTMGGQDKRDRAGTVLLYLEDTEEGGETVFPYLNLKVKPKKGNAIIFNSMDVKSGTCQEFSKHEANPVFVNKNVVIKTSANNDVPYLEDEIIVQNNKEQTRKISHQEDAINHQHHNKMNSKTILQRWYYYQSSPNLGKRVRPPLIPERKDNTPLVACDGIGGYCRWYDEWQFTHLIDYRQQFGLTNGIPSKNSFVWK